MTISVKDDLHRLIDELDEDQAARLLQVVGDPLARSLMLAPLDDEPLTDEDKAAVAEGESAYRRGDWTADEELNVETPRYSWPGPSSSLMSRRIGR